MAVKGEKLPHCSGTGESTDPYIFTDEIGFMEAIAVEECYMEAGTSNMTFDCNNGIVTAPLVFKYASFNAKGLTIFNLLANKIYQPLITMSGSWSRTTMNLNIYNFCCIMYGSYSGKSEIIYMEFEQYGAQAATANFLNCNFAGIRVGYNQNQTCMFGKNANPSNAIVQPIFTNCTFNVNFSDPTANSSYGNPLMFRASSVSPIALINSTICLSGTVYGTFTLTGKDGSAVNNPTVVFDTVTVTNTQTNRLTCGAIRIFPGQYGYNYYKLWVTATGSGSEIRDSLGLINTSRLTGSIALTGIQMQETNPAASDYIYNDTNLADKNFLVGQVIT